MCFTLAVAACGRIPESAPAPAESSTPRHVLLITIDTLRADRLGSYGHREARTPTLDALARRGVRFTKAYASAPITLTSHATLLTGRYPPGHGARHNGMALHSDVPSLPQAFKRAGFETGAFVSAFPLDKRFGLTKGFDTYDDELPRGDDGRRLNERAGAVTVDRAIAWIRGRSAAARLFVWVHLFEPHAPYGSPGQSARTVSARYDDEVATADRDIGRLLDAWPDAARTLVIATADHGEAFGEHDEIGHSIFVYDTTLQVPMILAGPTMPAASTVETPVTLADLAPTIASSGGLPAFDADGIDLRPLMNGGRADGRALYAESFAPLLDFGWAPLRSLRRDRLKLIAAPRPELYDLASDPREERNVIDARRDLARDLAARVDRIAGPDLPARTPTIDPEVRARLNALGYASGGSPAARSRPDPKDRIVIASRMASVTSGELRGAAAEKTLRDLIRADAGNAQAQQRLGFILAESGRCAEAERHFAAAVAAALPSADPHLGMAMCQAQRGNLSQALATLHDARRVEPGNPVVDANIGLLQLERGRAEAAIEPLTRALAADADLHQARFALARAMARSGRRAEALREATALLARLPASAPQRPEVERLVAALR